MRLERCLAGMVLIGSSMAVQGASITATVTVGANNWAQVNLFTFLTWDEINTQCPAGVCGAASVLNGWDMDGWKWADVNDVNGLFNHYIGSDAFGPDSIGMETISLMDGILADGWEPTADYYWNGFNYIHDILIMGFHANTVPRACCGNAATIEDREVNTAGVPFSHSTYWSNGDGSAVASESIGAWFYRPSEVPIPASTWLFGSAILGLGVVKRKKV